ncbi:hypothetical protein I8752_23235 [Nostocaceae cyanobacterium CENA369]|uniref:Uncharacterized protein n=1 Tax=Dendronalium phyllosphericum CENA369 TaxID=1725256 RepID=A0A8J7I6N8_9NOST|nr:hypothetical protein [Dendronalium phyllosphericum]MBH8575860.1 hypothetical protein [Dendronalium phyllosphericum CENA369]
MVSPLAVLARAKGGKWRTPFGFLSSQSTQSAKTATHSPSGGTADLKNVSEARGSPVLKSVPVG